MADGAAPPAGAAAPTAVGAKASAAAAADQQGGRAVERISIRLGASFTDPAAHGTLLLSCTTSLF